MTRIKDSEGDSATVDTDLYERISRRTARVGVVGIGYVGLPMMVSSASAGFDVTGIDIDERRVEQINAGNSYIEDVSSGDLSTLVQQRKICGTTDFSVFRDLDIIVICVPTPVDRHKAPELDGLHTTVRALAKYKRHQQLVLLQSTTFPGTTDSLVLPSLQEPEFQVGKDFYLAFSPERIDPGNTQFAMHNIPKVVGGVTPECGRMATAFLSCIVEKVIPVSSPKVAETTKLLENIFRSVNIALVNELSEVCQRMDIDIWEVIHAASTKPFGYMPFYPGIGVGGHCIPVDPFYLSWKAKEYDFYVDFIELAAKTNDNRPYYVVSRIVDILGDKGLPLKGAAVLLLGLSFKKDIQDARNSPAMRVAELLSEKGGLVSYSDPHVPQATIGNTTLNSVQPDAETLRQQAATVVLVAHSSFDMKAIVDNSNLVIDAVDATRLLGPNSAVVKL